MLNYNGCFFFFSNIMNVLIGDKRMFMEIKSNFQRQYIPFTARLCFDCTNNIAEYEACALGIRAAIDFVVRLLKVYGDSTLVIHQLKVEWESRDNKLVPYQAYIRGLRNSWMTYHFITFLERKTRWPTLLPLYHPCSK